MNLTEPQRRHLTELAEIYAKKGSAFWTPIGSGEKRCAEVLFRQGLLARHWLPHSDPQFELTPAGRDAVAVGESS